VSTPPTLTFPKGSLGAAALYYAVELGWSVFPLVPRDKIPLFSKKQGGRGLYDATTNPEQIGTWWTQHPQANIGIATGAASGIIVVDVDGEQGEAALALYGALPATPESRTGKGRHLLFSGNAIRNSAGKLGPQLDVRGDGGYIVAPPSIHPNGHAYRWATALHPGKVEVAPLPAIIADRLAGVVGAIAPDGIAPGRQAVDVVLLGVVEGGRNQALTEYVGRLLRMGARELEVLELARGVNATKFRPPLPDAEVEAIVQNIAASHARNTPARVTGPATAEQIATPLVSVTVDVFEAMYTRALQPVDAIATMWPTWNRACRMYGGGIGLARGWHIVAAGGAGAGKSLLALNLTAPALRAGHSVGWVSLEMSREQLLLRLLGVGTGRTLRDLEPGRSFDASAFSSAAYELTQQMHETGGALWMAERPARDLPSVVRLLREAVDAGCRLLVLDYLQMVSVPGAQKLDDAMRQVSAAVQSVAYRFDVTTLALSQLNRSTTSDRDASPTMHGLAGSSGIENDADQVLLIDHTTRQETAAGKTFNVLLDKNRHGPGAVIPVRMETETLRIVESLTLPATRAAELPLRDRAPRRDFYEHRDAR
jgi:KaiC/GvpD/RAD55 family RecA-like ATPase